MAHLQTYQCNRIFSVHLEIVEAFLCFVRLRMDCSDGLAKAIDLMVIINPNMISIEKSCT